MRWFTSAFLAALLAVASQSFAGEACLVLHSNSAEDSTLVQALPGANWLWQNQYLIVGDFENSSDTVNPDGTAPSYLTKAVLKFHLDDVEFLGTFTGSVPTLTSAHLTFWAQASAPGPNFEFRLSEVPVAWDETTVGWGQSLYPGTSGPVLGDHTWPLALQSWDVADPYGLDLYPDDNQCNSTPTTASPHGSCPVTRMHVASDDLRSLVQSWLDLPGQNHGLMFEPHRDIFDDIGPIEDLELGSYMRIFSSNHTREDRKPSLTLCYCDENPTLYYLDEDQDGYGAADDPGALFCEDPSTATNWYSPTNHDCDDDNYGHSPVYGDTTGDCEITQADVECLEALAQYIYHFPQHPWPACSPHDNLPPQLSPPLLTPNEWLDAHLTLQAMRLFYESL